MKHGCIQIHEEMRDEHKEAKGEGGGGVITLMEEYGIWVHHHLEEVD